MTSHRDDVEFLRNHDVMSLKPPIEKSCVRHWMHPRIPPPVDPPLGDASLCSRPRHFQHLPQ